MTRLVVVGALQERSRGIVRLPEMGGRTFPVSTPSISSSVILVSKSLVTKFLNLVSQGLLIDRCPCKVSSDTKVYNLRFLNLVIYFVVSNI